MRILFVDDDPEHVALVARTIADALGADAIVVTTVERALHALQAAPFDLVITDIFIPLGEALGDTLGPRARRYAETVQHLGGLVLLDEIDRMDPAPRVLAHTATTDHALLQVLGGHVIGHVPKPAPVDVLLRAVLEALDLPAPQ